MAKNINVATLQNKQVFNFDAPCEGTKVVPLPLDFSTDTEFDLDLSLAVQQSKISMLQTLFIDLSDTASAMVVTIDPLGLKQTIVANGRTQGYYPVLSPNPPLITFVCASGQIERIFLINAPIAGSVWAATHP